MTNEQVSKHDLWDFKDLIIKFIGTYNPTVIDAMLAEKEWLCPVCCTVQETILSIRRRLYCCKNKSTPDLDHSHAQSSSHSLMPKLEQSGLLY